jgi:hypothetical protein
MKILHIHDQAGVACILTKYQRINGLESKVVSLNEIDKFGILKFYKDYVDIIDRANFVEYCLAEAKSADIIHIHSMEELIIKIRKAFGNSKKIILHYHGSDIRGFKNLQPQNSYTIQNIKDKTNIIKHKIRNRLWLIKRGYYKSLRTECQKLANEIVLATPDLLSILPQAKYLPNPVDVEHFSKDNVYNNKFNKKALTIKTENADSEKALQYCKENNVDLDIDVFDRTKAQLSYEEMPNLLKKYSLYIDIRIDNGKILENFSKTALESLSCGLEVLNYKLEYIERLPEKHHPVNVTNELKNIYNKI